jgi:uncharacterized phiE125 gp8 family phage protein
MSEVLAPKAPPEVLDYLIDATGLLQEGETLIEGSSSVAVTGGGAVKDSQSFTDSGVTVWISGGTLGVPIRVTASLRTSGGRTFQRIYVIPFREPVSLEDAKAQCGIIDDDSQDMLLAGYISAARAHIEKMTGKLLVKREVTQTFDCFGLALDLWHGPIDEEAGIAVSYTDADGNAQDYEDAVLQASRCRLFPARDGWWPPLGRHGTVTVTYTAGYEDPAVDAPELQQAVLMLVAHWFQNREATVAGSAAAAVELPLGVAELCASYRRVLL